MIFNRKGGFSTEDDKNSRQKFITIIAIANIIIHDPFINMKNLIVSLSGFIWFSGTRASKQESASKHWGVMVTKKYTMSYAECNHSYFTENNVLFCKTPDACCFKMQNLKKSIVQIIIFILKILNRNFNNRFVAFHQTKMIERKTKWEGDGDLWTWRRHKHTNRREWAQMSCVSVPLKFLNEWNDIRNGKSN